VSAWRIDSYHKAVSSHNVVAGKESHARMSSVIVGFPAEAALIVVECVGGLCRGDARFEKGVSGEIEAADIFEHGFVLDGRVVWQDNFVESGIPYVRVECRVGSR
jgi:hypothetical protein